MPLPTDMDTSLKIISKEFGFKISDKRKPTNVRFSVSETLKAAARLGRRPYRPHLAPVSLNQQAATLPPELLDHILDYLHDDNEALRNCSLVCHALVPSARYHLFQKVKITQENFVRATTIFAGDSPHLTQYVRDLTLELPMGSLNSTLGRLRSLLANEEAPVLLRVFMLVLSPRMPNVLRLTLKDVPVDQSVVAMLAPNFPQLHTLSLFDCWFSCNADFYAILRDHPAVRHLRCGRLSSLFGSEALSQEDVVPPRSLQTLKITEAYSTSPLTLIPWLVTHSNPEHYTYTLYRLGQVTKLNQCLVQLSCLKHLHVIFYRWRTEDVEEVAVTPAVLTLIPRHPPTITTLTVDTKIHSVLLAVSLLGHLDPHAFAHLRTLNILMHLHEEFVKEVPLESWAAMDQTLSVLLSLGAINVCNVCSDMTHLEAGKDAVEARLPVLSVRGLLRFDQKWQPLQLKF
ncbi:hypothetical protein DICSQDRAFT_181833 [Dichomitus squalens LYAD-421 SS1]|uniref:Uncharacterized protein n=2 Tax=Dichomitus squalens TaxID=114155 RepID=A0A4Q9P954_9APHY|nr:uncharacterized protein DICSQDRAFT_181833 [Dichomitus squalens LYAD-421 SS1]EJF59674.1 hypothetical protein DICSQDRAFT_181833 [Dichomitus squalens LYAD-421 SS1]TBU51139.1 hypothetical protein BD310DRAFT_1043669 [Dichomitus squalens]